MTRYVALLRGINVGRNQRIAMADLRSLLSSLGHADVATLLQSGNAVFSSARRSSSVLADELEKAIAREFGLTVRCLVQTAEKLRSIIEENPLPAPDGSRFLVSFLFEPVPADRALPDPGGFSPELVHIGSRALYLWCADGIQNSRVIGEFSEKRLGVAATARNWNTVTKILAMAER